MARGREVLGRLPASVVTAVLLVGAGCRACPRITKESREAVLRTDLKVMRDVVGQYEHDAGCLHDLEQLVADGYLRQLPRDPFAAEGSTWLAVRNDAGCIQDVRSTSMETALDGSPYREW